MKSCISKWHIHHLEGNENPQDQRNSIYKNKIVGNYVIIVLGQESADNFTGRICDVLDTEYDIQIFPPKMKIKAFWNRALLQLHTQVCFLHIMLTPKACFIGLAKKSIYFMWFILRHPTCINVSFHKDTCIRMLKNISNKVKMCQSAVCQDSTFLRLSFCPVYLDCRENYEYVNGYNSTALFSLKVPLFFLSQMSGHNTLQMTLL